MQASANQSPPSIAFCHYNLLCPTCNKPIRRGDDITTTLHGEGLQLRPRLLPDGTTYTPNTGCDHVHLDCTYLMDEWTRYTVDDEDADAETDAETDEEWEEVEPPFVYC